MPADRAGLRGGTRIVEVRGQNVCIGGDIILAIDGQPIETLDDLNAALDRDPGRWEIEIERNGRRISGSVTI